MKKNDKVPILKSVPKRARTTTKSTRRRHLDERLRSLQERIRLLENQLIEFESKYYRVCIFGSARIEPQTPVYSQVVSLARLLSSRGIDILTGGGPGLMEAANFGAQLGRAETDAKSRSYGLSIQLDWEPTPNAHLDIKRHHNKFSSRLDDFILLSHAVICTPGGIGTLLELLFAWQLIQVNHIKPRPIVLLDSTFWNGFLSWMREVPLTRKLMSEKDFQPLSVVDTPEEALQIISQHHELFLTEKAKTKTPS